MAARVLETDAATGVVAVDLARPASRGIGPVVEPAVLNGMPMLLSLSARRRLWMCVMRQ